MAQKQELEITIGNDGTVIVNVFGQKGSSCLELTQDLEESLGVLLNREKKVDFYNQEKPAVTVTQGREA
jgi:hypothetical protein